MKKLFLYLFMTLALIGSFSAAHAAGIDSNTLLIAHMNGTDGSTTIVDSDPSPRTLTPFGNFQIDTAQSKFGSASALSDGTNDYYTAPDSDDFAFGTSDFAIEGWYRFAANGSSQTLYSQNDGANAIYLQWYQPTGILSFQSYVSAALTVNATATWTPTVNTWYHIALTRSGTTFKYFVNGVQVGTSYVSGGAIANAAATVYIGAKPDGSNAVNGWVDEFRISKTARFTSNFTPETSEYTAPTPPPAPDVGESENEYWKDRAALLDPEAYEYHSGVFSVTKTVHSYLLNGWQLTSGGDTTKFWYHRKADIANALLIPAGTSVQHAGSPSGQNYNFDWGYALLGVPDLVTSDSRYEDGRDLYYQRLEKLKGLKLRSLKVKIAQTHTATQAQTAGTNVAAFPTSTDGVPFENGLLVHFSTMDGSWIVLESDTNVTTPLSPSYRILNLSDELDDARSVRFTGAVMIPFKRSDFPTMRIGFGSAFLGACTGVNTPSAGCQGPNHPINSAYATTATYPAYGQVMYYNLDELSEPW